MVFLFCCDSFCLVPTTVLYTGCCVCDACLGAGFGVGGCVDLAPRLEASVGLGPMRMHVET